MSKIIEIIEENNELSLAKDEPKIVCGNSNYKLKFTLSEDWKNANHKAVVFCVCGKKTTITIEGDECDVPVMHGGGVLFVSLVAGDEDSQLATTDVKIELVETFSNVDFAEFEPLRNDLSSLLGAVNDIEKGNIVVKEADVAKNVSNPNLLINGDFKVNQRGATTYTEAGKYTVDRWRLVSGSVEVKSNGIMLNGTIVQKLEHSPSMQVVASSNAGTISYSNGAVTLSTTTATLITYAKLEIGTTATPLSPRPYAEELAMCQRYYEMVDTKSLSNKYQIYRIARTTYSLYQNQVELAVTKRVMPTITLFSSSTGERGKLYNNTKNIDQEFSIGYNTTKSFHIGNSKGDMSVNDIIMGYFEADAEIY